jgi:hypothetical protein
MKVLKISTLNKFYDKISTLKTLFLNAIVDDLQIKFEIPEEDFKDLKKVLITISNHPLGGLMVLLLKIKKREPNFKIIANFLLHRIEL